LSKAIDKQEKAQQKRRKSPRKHHKADWLTGTTAKKNESNKIKLSSVNLITIKWVYYFFSKPTNTSKKMIFLWFRIFKSTFQNFPSNLIYIFLKLKRRSYCITVSVQVLWILTNFSSFHAASI
jgi:hypothetical protein